MTSAAARELPIPELLIVAAIALVYPGWFDQVSLEIHVIILFEGALVLTTAYLHLVIGRRLAEDRSVSGGNQDPLYVMFPLKTYDVLVLAIGVCLFAFGFGGGSYLIPVFIFLPIHSMVLLAVTISRRRGRHIVRVLTRITLIFLFLMFVVAWPLLAIAHIYGT